MAHFLAFIPCLLMLPVSVSFLLSLLLLGMATDRLSVCLLWRGLKKEQDHLHACEFFE